MQSGNDIRRKNRIVKRIVLSLIILVLVVLFTANADKIVPKVQEVSETVVGVLTGESALSAEERAAIEKERQERAKRIKEAYDKYFTKEDKIGAAVEVVLSVENPMFYAGKPIDDSFILWFISHYGEEALDRVVQGAYFDGDSSVWRIASGHYFNAMWLMYCRDTGLYQDELADVTFVDTASDDRIIMSFTGDINLDDKIGTMKKLKRDGLDACISHELQDILKGSDITMINNECPYSLRGAPLQGKAYTFRADPENVNIIKELGVDIVGIANNHMCDYGLDAVSDTIDVLDEADLPHVGAGNNIDEAMKPHYFVANGVKIAIVAATQIERSLNYTKEATTNSPGVLKCLNPEKFNEVIKQADENADFVIAFVHWGTENDPKYAADQIRLAENFVEHGADAIVGGHTHCLQGITYVEDSPVIYSLGNFWFGATATDGISEKQTGISQIVIESDGTLNFRFIPCIQKDQATYLCSGEEWDSVIDYEESLSTGVSIDMDGYIHRVIE